MKNIILKLLRLIVRQLARLTIWRYRPAIIGITGSVGKTSSKLAIEAVLKDDRRVRVSPHNFNNELGVPLTIISDRQDISGWLFWPGVIFKSIKNIIIPCPYPEILILEYGIDRPGDMKYLLGIARPSIAVVTAIGDVPVHVEYFSGPQEVAREKARIIEQLPTGGFAVLNRDNDVLMDLKERTRAHLLTFGYSRQANVRVTGFSHKIENNRPAGVAFKIEYAGSFVPVRLNNIYGKTQGYAAATAAAVGMIFGLNLVRISESLKKNYQPPPHRLQILAGIKDTMILDDTYNASPLSVLAALDTISELPAKRRIAVLGDMLELGQFAMSAHEEIGEAAKNNVNILVTVGPRAKFIAEGAKNKGLNKKNIYSFNTADEARSTVQSLLKKGDLVLIKGSRAMQLESIVEEIKNF